MQICRPILRAACRRANPVRWLCPLFGAIDDLSLSARLANGLQAFRSCCESQAIAALAVLGPTGVRQVWLVGLTVGTVLVFDLACVYLGHCASAAAPFSLGRHASLTSALVR